MNDKTTGGKSPFYEKYTGKYKENNKFFKTYGYHVRKDFVKPLKEFFDARFGADASNNEIMEQIVQQYYFSFAHERTYYEKTIVALIHKSELEKENPYIIPLLLSNGFAKNDAGVLNNNKQHKRITAFQFRAYTRRYKDIGIDLKDRIVKRIFNDGYDTNKAKVFYKLKNFNEDSLNDFIVLEIALNNYLDASANGVYAYLQENGVLKENQHVGVVIANSRSEITGIEPFPIVFNWRLNLDFSIDILDIVKLSESDLAKSIEDYNYGLVTVLNPILNFGYSLEKRLVEKDKLIEDMELMLNHEKQERLKIVDAIEKNKTGGNLD